MGTTQKSGEKYMTVGMLEDELKRVRAGLTDVIRALTAMDRREPVTNIPDPRLGRRIAPYACPAVSWECKEKIWTLRPVSQRRMTTKVREAIDDYFAGVIPCLGRIARYIDTHTKD